MTRTAGLTIAPPSAAAARGLFLALALAAAPAGAAPAPHEVTGPAIATLLSGRKVVYEGEAPMWQDWSADGTTRTTGPGPILHAEGWWQITDGRYCERFGVQTDWTCWRVTEPAPGAVWFWEIPKDFASAVLFHRAMRGRFAD